MNQTLRILSAVTLAFGILGGCGSDTTVATHNEEPHVSERQIERTIEEVEQLLATQRAPHSGPVLAPAALRKALIEGALGDEMSEARALGIHDAYAARHYRPFFTNGSALSAEGIALAEEVLDARRHGLNREDLHVERLTTAIQALRETASATVEDSDVETLTQAERTELEAWLNDIGSSGRRLPPSDAIAHLILTNDSRSPIEAYGQRSDQDTEEIDPTATIRAELILADSFVRLGEEMRFHNPYTFSERTARRDGVNIENTDTIALIGTKQATALLQQAFTMNDFDAALASLQPQFGQYEALLQGVDQYRDYVRAGGWSDYELDRELSAGRTHEQVAVLRKRLNAEGYWSGDLESEHFSAELSTALEEYQRTHQLPVNGDVDEHTLASLNISAERRLAQIRQTLRRWHETRLEADRGEEYIVVNLPDFHAELWDNGELVYRWATIVGKLKRLRDEETGEMRYWGATPLFSDEMEHIVFNPYWNVPGNIWANEYADKIEEDPEYLDEHNFEIITNTAGNRFLRQKPGPDNALGLVKFLFPNEHDVYLHDTNRPALFQYDIRAFSHGCIRVHEALELAAVLLSRDRESSISSARFFINEMLERGEEQWVGLRRHIPVHFEYFAVRADENGRMNFLADVYRYDRADVDALESEIIEYEAAYQRDGELLQEQAVRAYQRSRFERQHGESQSQLVD